MANIVQLEADFDQAMHDVYLRAKSEYKYDAKIFKALLAQHKGLKVAQDLLKTDAPQYSLLRLRELDALHISMENTVLNPKFLNLFLTREKDVARQRLTDFSFTPGGWEL
jgi:hypothetical protein